jgi:N utilization substance protein A
MKTEFEIAITQLAADRNLPPEVILEAIESALVLAYKKNFESDENVAVTIHPRTGQAQVFLRKTVVAEVTNADLEITLDDARTTAPNTALGDTIALEIVPRNFGRIAAQTAKQVITSRIREAERDSVYNEYFARKGEIVNATVRSIDARTGNIVLVLGKAEAILPRSEQIPSEHYRPMQRLRVYLAEVEKSPRGPQIIASRAHRDLLKRLLELEVPEVYNGTVEVKAIAREPGSRSKVAVAALQPGVEPVGSCVGPRGVRVLNIINELNGEKIDVVAWASDERTFIAKALSPAEVVAVYLNPFEHTAKVVVPDTKLSLAIGKEGQNARLAAKLTGWRIDIKSETEAAAEADQIAAEMAEAERRAQEMEEARRAAVELLAQAEASLMEEEPVAEPEPVVVAELEAVAIETPVADAESVPAGESAGVAAPEAAPTPAAAETPGRGRARPGREPQPETDEEEEDGEGGPGGRDRRKRKGGRPQAPAAVPGRGPKSRERRGRTPGRGDWGGGGDEWR